MECTSFTTVGDYDSEEGQVEIFLKRIVGSSAGNDILWMVPDGPGLSGAMYEPIVTALMSALNNRYTIYLMDHRGTGRSEPALHCPDEPGTGEESPEGDCTTFLNDNFGDTIEYFNSYAIVRDYQLLTDILTDSNDVVLFYGSGYGAFVINQLLIEDPEIADAVIMDSAMLPSITEYDTNAQDTGLDFVDRCQNFGDCRKEIDSRDPEELVQEVFAQFSDLTCPNRLSLAREEVQTIFRNLAADQDYRPLLLPIVVRMLRCNSDDLDYLDTGIHQFNEFFYETLSLRSANSSITEGESYVFRNNIEVNELLRVDRGIQPNSQTLLGLSEQQFFSNYLPSFVSGISDGWLWDKNENVEEYEFGISSVPMFILAAEFDMKTSPRYSARMADIYDNQFQRFLEIPFAGHNVLTNSPTSNGGICGFELIAEFINQGPGNFNPFEISTSCIARLEPVDFAAQTQRTKEISSFIFGDSEPWGNGPIPLLNGGTLSLSSGYVVFPFSSNDLPEIPNLSISQIIVFDSYDTSNPKTTRNTLSYISTGFLPPSAWFSPDGAVVGAASSLSTGCLLLVSLFIVLLI